MKLKIASENLANVLRSILPMAKARVEWWKELGVERVGGWSLQQIALAEGAIRRAEALLAEKLEETDKHEAAVLLGAAGGEKGGDARARSLTPERRQEIARQAAVKRWRKE